MYVYIYICDQLSLPIILVCLYVCTYMCVSVSICLYTYMYSPDRRGVIKSVTMMSPTLQVIGLFTLSQVDFKREIRQKAMQEMQEMWDKKEKKTEA